MSTLEQLITEYISKQIIFTAIIASNPRDKKK